FSGQLQLQSSSMQNPSSSDSQRMSKCNCSSIWVNSQIIIIQTHCPRTSQSLCGKRLVQFNNIYIFQGQACTLKCFFGRLYRTYSHDSRLYTNNRRTNNSSQGC